MNGGLIIKFQMNRKGENWLHPSKKILRKHQNGAFLKNTDDVSETIFLGLGSNLDQPIRQIHRAIESLGAFVNSIERATLYRSKPMGPQDQPDFVNTVIKGQTNLSPEDLLGFVNGLKTSKQVKQSFGALEQSI